MTKLLLIEDDIFLVKVYKLKLEKIGYEVKYLESGEGALELAIDYQPDLILLDIIMPIKDGFQVLTELKLNPATTGIPVLILSSLQMDKDIAHGKSLGAKEYLAKAHHTFDQVMETVKNLTA